MSIKYPLNLKRGKAGRPARWLTVEVRSGECLLLKPRLLNSILGPHVKG